MCRNLCSPLLRGPTLIESAIFPIKREIPSRASPKKLAGAKKLLGEQNRSLKLAKKRVIVRDNEPDFQRRKIRKDLGNQLLAIYIATCDIATSPIAKF